MNIAVCIVFMHPQLEPHFRQGPTVPKGHETLHLPPAYPRSITPLPHQARLLWPFQVLTPSVSKHKTLA